MKTASLSPHGLEQSFVGTCIWSRCSLSLHSILEGKVNLDIYQMEARITIDRGCVCGPEIITVIVVDDVLELMRTGLLQREWFFSSSGKSVAILQVIETLSPRGVIDLRMLHSTAT